MFRSVLTSKTKTTDFLECRLRVGLRNWTNLEYFIDLVWTSKSKKKRRTLDIMSISDIISAWASKQERKTDLGYYIGLDFKQERIFFRTDFGYYIDLGYYIGLDFKQERKRVSFFYYREGSWMLYVESIFKSFVSIWNISRCLSTSYWIDCSPELCC
ncbi:unnamed protein product [Rhizophagus irregularis]|nr:unnamed protein product [Rhizophagus irregularis]